MIYSLILIGGFQLLFASNSRGQSLEEIIVTIKLADKNLEHLLKDIELQTHLTFAYLPSDVRKYNNIGLQPGKQSVKTALDKALGGTELSYRYVENSIIIFPRGDVDMRKTPELMAGERSNDLYLPSSSGADDSGIIHVLSATSPLKIFERRLVRNISGHVMDTNGEPLIGVNVQVKGTNKGTATNIDGRFSFSDIDDKAVLVVSYIGYKSQEVAVEGQTNLTIVMQEDAQTLDEVVVVGYGTMKKSDLTGSVSSIKSEELNAMPSSNILQALQGRSSGVHVKQNSGSPGGAVSVRIRGTNSIQGSNEPLYVIDGFPSSSSNPTVLDNSSIESIEILKDASAIAIYGSRGANGVVLITTKRGKEGRTTVDYGTTYGFQSLRKKIEVMNATEYAQFYNLQRKNDGVSPYFSEEEIRNFGEGFDWQDFIFETAPVQTHELSVRGGNEKTNFAILGNVFDQRGIIEGSGYKRFSLTANIDHEISNKVRMNFSSTLSQNKLDNKNWGGARFGASLISVAVSAPPTLTPYNEDGSYRVLATEYPFLSEGMTNPLNYIKERDFFTKSNQVLSNLSLEYRPIEALIFKIYGGVENNDNRSDSYTTIEHVNSDGSASVSTSQYKSFLNENTVTYNKVFGRKHNFSALAGFTLQDFVSTSLSGSGRGFLSDVTKTGNVGSAELPGIPGTGYSKSVLMSFLGRVNYIFNNRYLFTLNFRNDGSSKYSEGNKWALFPSGAIAWRIIEENFMENIGYISDLKLRSSYGMTGSQAIGAYATLNNLSSSKTVFGNELYTSFAPGSRLPGDLRWETTAQFDLGVDLGIMNNRYYFTADYYNKITSNLLNSVQLPPSSGYTNTLQNVGEIQNKGFELSLGAKVLDGQFSWDLSGNISFNKTKVKKLYEGQDVYGGWQDMLIIAADLNLLREGEPMSAFYGYIADGYDEEGFEKYKDLNSDGKIDSDDKIIIGDPNPDFIYALNSNINFKNFGLSIFFQGSHGNDIVNVSSIENSLNYGYGMNMYKDVFYNHWTPEQTDAKYPKISRDQRMRFSDRIVEDGSYLRLRNIQLSYDFSLERTNVNFVENINLYISAQNILTFTKYSGWDPEVNSAGGASSIAQGIDHHTFPTAKSITFGVNVTF